MKAIKLITLILLLNSCISEKKKAEICQTCPTTTEVVTKEVIKVTNFDTTLFLSTLGKDLSFNNDESDCCILVNQLTEQMAANNGTITAKENGVKSSIFKVKNKITFRCEADSLKAVIKGLRTEISNHKDKVITKTVIAECKREHKKWFDKFYFYWFLITLAIIIGYFLPQIVKLIKRFI